MAAPGVSPKSSELIIDRFGQEIRTALLLDRYRLGRNAGNELAFPEDTRLSREHLVFEKVGNRWEVRDLRSSNGTKVNGEKITAPKLLRDGDRIVAGSLLMVFHSPFEEAEQPSVVAFLNEPDTDAAIAIDLESALRSGIGRTDLDSTHFSALLQAGRELARYRPLSELFDLILELSLNAVKATRGVLMTFENDALIAKSSIGENFRISTTIRDRVLRGESLLVEDTSTSRELAGIHSLVAANVRSILTVPLQSDRGVLGLIYLDSPGRVRHFTADDLSLITVMANIAGIRIEHARLLEVEQAERQLARELDQAAEIQMRLLPSSPPEWKHLDVSGFNAACRKVGGDYYDFWAYPDGSVAVFIADVSGKGMPAALLMSNLQASAHVLFDTPSDLAERVSRLNRAVATNTPPTTFITFFVGIVDPQNKRLIYCNAGHNPPILLRASGQEERLDPTGMVLGIMPQARYSEKQCAFEQGDSLLLFSDGVTEAGASDSPEEFGEDRLIQIFKDAWDRPAAEIIESIKTELIGFSSSMAARDDVTLVVVRR